MPNEQHFPAWPLITAVITPSPRAGAYTAKVEFPHAPVRILKRSELPPLRREVIAKVQQWANDDWHKPVRLQVEDPDGRWVLGVPRAGAIVELDTIAAVEPPPLRSVSPASPPLPAAAPSDRRRQPAAPPAQDTARPRLTSHAALRPRVLAAGALTLVLAAGAYAIASTGSAPVRTRASAPTTRLNKGVSAASPAAATLTVTTAAHTAPAAARTAAHRARRHAPARRHRQEKRRTRRRAPLRHRRVVSDAPSASAPASTTKRISRSARARARTPRRPG